MQTSSFSPTQEGNRRHLHTGLWGQGGREVLKEEKRVDGENEVTSCED